jgi:hypothetical protein
VLICKNTAPYYNPDVCLLCSWLTEVWWTHLPWI